MSFQSFVDNLPDRWFVGKTDKAGHLIRIKTDIGMNGYNLTSFGTEDEAKAYSKKLGKSNSNAPISLKAIDTGSLWMPLKTSTIYGVEYLKCLAGEAGTFSFSRILAVRRDTPESWRTSIASQVNGFTVYRGGGADENEYGQSV